MAIVAKTAVEPGRVVRMLCQVFGKGLMALKTGGIAFHALGHLVGGRTLMHGMAGDARHLTFYKTWRFYEAVVFAPGDSDHPVGPERASTVLSRLLTANDVYLRLQIVAGVEALAARKPFFFIARGMNAMAPATNVG